MAEDFVNKIDLDGEQWDLQDTKAQGDITEIKAEMPDRLESIFTGNIDNTKFSIPVNGSTVTANYTGLYYVTVRKTNNNSIGVTFTEDGTSILAGDLGTGGCIWTPFTLLIRKGHTYRFLRSSDTGASFVYQNFIPFNFG